MSRADLYENLKFEQCDEQARFAAFVEDAGGEDDEAVTDPHPEDPPLAGLAKGDLLSVQFDDQTPGFSAGLATNPTVKALTGRTVDTRV